MPNNKGIVYKYPTYEKLQNMVDELANQIPLDDPIFKHVPLTVGWQQFLHRHGYSDGAYSSKRKFMRRALSKKWDKEIWQPANIVM